MEILDKISEEVGKLNYEWFEAKKSRFISEGLYNVNADKIEGSIYANGEEEIDTDYSITLINYCWNSWFPDTSFPEEHLPKIVNSKEVVTLIISLIKTELRSYAEDAKHLLIEKCKQHFAKRISENFAQQECQDYIDCLYYVDEQWKKALYKAFRKIKQQYNLQNAVVDQIEFAIPKEQVAALFFLLAKAKILNVSSEFDLTHISFIEKHFAYKSRNGYLICNNIKRKYQDILNDDSTSVQMIIKSLKKVIK